MNLAFTDTDGENQHDRQRSRRNVNGRTVNFQMLNQGMDERPQVHLVGLTDSIGKPVLKEAASKVKQVAKAVKDAEPVKKVVRRRRRVPAKDIVYRT